MPRQTKLDERGDTMFRVGVLVLLAVLVLANCTGCGDAKAQAAYARAHRKPTLTKEEQRAELIAKVRKGPGPEVCADAREAAFLKKEAAQKAKALADKKAKAVALAKFKAEHPRKYAWLTWKGFTLWQAGGITALMLLVLAVYYGGRRRNGR